MIRIGRITALESSSGGGGARGAAGSAENWATDASGGGGTGAPWNPGTSVDGGITIVPRGPDRRAGGTWGDAAGGCLAMSGEDGIRYVAGAASRSALGEVRGCWGAWASSGCDVRASEPGSE
jgi:hypothetical protein